MIQRTDTMKLRIGFSALQILYWCAYGSTTTYIVSYMTAVRGASASISGMLIAVFMLCACAGQFLVNAICDKHQNNRTVFALGMVICLLLWYAVYFSPSILLLFVLYGLMGVLQPTLASVLDTWLIRSFPDDPGAYSPIRATASLGYSALMLVMGFGLDTIGHKLMLILPTIFTILAVLVSWQMPEIPPLTHAPGKEQTAAPGLRSIQPIFWMLIIAMMFFGTANMPLLTLNLLIMENVGGSVSNQGIATAFNTLAEFLTMWFGMKLLARVSAYKKLMLSGILYLASTALILFGGNVYVLYLAFFINGISYGVHLPSRRQYINETAPENMLNRLHGLGDMAYNNIGGLAGNQISGMLADNLGVRFMVGFSWAFQGIAFAIMSCFKRFQKKGIDSAA